MTGAAFVIAAAAWVAVVILLVGSWASEKADRALADVGLDEPVPYRPADDWMAIADAVREDDVDRSLSWSRLDDVQFWRLIDSGGPR